METIDIKQFTKWALTQSGFTLRNNELYFYNFKFSDLESSVQNKQINKFNNK